MGQSITGRGPARFHQPSSFAPCNFCLESAKFSHQLKKREKKKKEEEKKLSINRLMKYENVYGPFNLPNCSSIIHLSDTQLYQQEFIPELPLFSFLFFFSFFLFFYIYDAFIIFVLLDTVYIFISSVRCLHIGQLNAFHTLLYYFPSEAAPQPPPALRPLLRTWL